MKTIGLIGGMSWESTVPYYRIINEEVKARLLATFLGIVISGILIIGYAFNAFSEASASATAAVIRRAFSR